MYFLSSIVGPIPKQEDNSYLLALPNHGGKPMKNEISFRLTGARRNAIFERTMLTANFRRRKNSSLATLARPYRGRTRAGICCGEALPLLGFASLTKFASQTSDTHQPLGDNESILAAKEVIE